MADKKSETIDENPSHNAMIDDIIGQLEFVYTLSVGVGMDVHFLSEIRHLQSTAAANKKNNKN